MGRWGNADFKNLEEFQNRLSQLDRDMDLIYQECLRELAARLLAKVIRRTPTGKKPEHLTKAPRVVKVKGSSGKSSSFLSKENMILQKYWAGYVGGTLKRSWTIGEVTRNGDCYTVEVINPTKYASYVEYGHRQTPGRYVPALGKSLEKGWAPGVFMLTISEQEIQRIIPALTDKILQKKLQELF